MNLRAVNQHDPIVHRLLSLRALGFRFSTNQDSGGLVVALVGIRVHHEVIDIGQFYGEHDADATRVPGDEPDILFPRRVLWRVTGSADHVIDNLLAIADPGTHRPPHGVG